MLVTLSNDITSNPLYLKHNLYLYLLDLYKQRIYINKRLKNRMSSEFQQQLTTQLAQVEQHLELVKDIWTLLHEDKGIPNVDQIADSLLRSVLNNALPERYTSAFINEQINLEQYRKIAITYYPHVYSGIQCTYAQFLEKIDMSTHFLHEQPLVIREQYYAAMYTLLNMLQSEGKSNILIFSEKVGVNNPFIFCDFNAITTLFSNHTIFSESGIKYISPNIVFLTELLLCLPYIVDDNFLDNEQYRKLLKLGTVEIKELIEFTNLLKMSKYEFIDSLFSIKKYEPLKMYYDHFSQFGYKEIEPFHRVLVIGTMSAGKSTFLNSLLGKNFFPSKNEACTAKIFEYSFYQKTHYEVCNKDEEVEVFECLDSEQLEVWNEEQVQQRLVISGPANPLLSTTKKLTFIDTPGPNNSMDATHREVMDEALDSDYEKIFYLLNATQLGTEDDMFLLRRIKKKLEENNRLVIYFIVNKVDEFENNESETLSTLQENVRKYLNAQGFEQPNFIFISALASKLIQQAINEEKLSRKERKQMEFFDDLFLDEAYDLSQYASYETKQFRNTISFHETINETQRKLLKYSGILEVLACI